MRLVFCLVSMLAQPALAEWGITEKDGFLTVDTGAGLVFKVKQAGGDITSIRFDGGPELQEPGKGSHIASGIGAKVSHEMKAGGRIGQITLTTPTLTQYLIVREKENNIYMATYVIKEPPVGELRWITRLQKEPFKTVPVYSDLRGTKGAIESKDVFGRADGTTGSKYYGNQRAMDLTIRGITGPGRGVFMAYGNRERSSGGPFYRDIQNQTTEVYNYMNSGHAQTEKYRLNALHGPYALCFTNGSTPTVPDMGFIPELGLRGYVGAAERGSAGCRGISGRDARYVYTVGFSNEAAQYWTVASGENGALLSKGMLPGIYKMQVYKNELSVHTENAVTVEAGKTAMVDPITITEDPSEVVPLWRIGDWDGTPLEFLNGNKINFTHPSDKRMGKWDAGTYVIGKSVPATGMQACQWKDVPGADKKIQFELSAGQIADSTVRVGITCATGGARPVISVNSWKSPATKASGQPESRLMTVGSYRGNNTTYTFTVPASALKPGVNTLTLRPLSGSDARGFLSPGYSLDCIEFSQKTARAGE